MIYSPADRLNLKTTCLDNGITVYSQHADVPFVSVSITIPVGVAHSHAQTGYGIAHFLEHVMLEHPPRSSHQVSLETFVTENGGDLNAWTNQFYTEYYMALPRDVFPQAFSGLIDQIFNPDFESVILSNHRGVIQNERNQRAQYFPQSNEIGHYLATEWKETRDTTLRQLFGFDEDLQQITPSLLSQFHRYYFTSQITVFVGGDVDLDVIKKPLSHLSLSSHIPEESYTPLYWKNSQYHEKVFKDLSNPLYVIGGFIFTPSKQNMITLSFLRRFLLNSTTGVLDQWLRRENGWSYGLNFNATNNGRVLEWNVEIPLNKKEQVNVVRAELTPRIQASLSDSKRIAKELHRQQASQVFDYQTVQSRIDTQIKNLYHFGRLYTEAENAKLQSSIANSQYLTEFYERHLAPEHLGEMLALPK